MKIRQNTTKLIEMVEEGAINKDHLIKDLLNWMSEADVTEFAEANHYIEEDEE